MFKFNPIEHRYTLDGREIPSVTTILADVIGVPWQASDWYLERGRAVHACAAMIARGIEFDHDPQIAGQVEACRRFFREFQPEVVEVETPHVDIAGGWAGTPDLVIQRSGKMVVDFKASFSACLQYQLAAYGELTGASRGFGVQLCEDATYRLSNPVRFDANTRARWGSLVAVHKMRREMGV
jgi:hypothetical protein